VECGFTSDGDEPGTLEFVVGRLMERRKFRLLSYGSMELDGRLVCGTRGDYKATNYKNKNTVNCASE
jgi:hypothetical protein